VKVAARHFAAIHTVDMLAKRPPYRPSACANAAFGHIVMPCVSSIQTILAPLQETFHI
jgi:hypothetical protein